MPQIPTASRGLKRLRLSIALAAVAVLSAILIQRLFAIQSPPGIQIVSGAITFALLARGFWVVLTPHSDMPRWIAIIAIAVIFMFSLWLNCSIVRL